MHVTHQSSIVYDRGVPYACKGIYSPKGWSPSTDPEWFPLRPKVSRPQTRLMHVTHHLPIIIPIRNIIMSFNHEELQDYISDLHKDMYGIRPRQYVWSELTVEELEVIADVLDDQANAMLVDSGLDNGWSLES